MHFFKKKFARTCVYKKNVVSLQTFCGCVETYKQNERTKMNTKKQYKNYD